MKAPESRDPDKTLFHYNREERERGLSEYARRSNGPAGGFFRGNRSLAIVVFDVLILVLLFVLISIYTKSRGQDLVFGRYEVALRAVQFDERVLVTLTLTARQETAGEDVTVFFRYGSGEDRIELTDFLPAREGESRAIREALPLRESADRVYADLVVGEARETVDTRVVRE